MKLRVFALLLALLAAAAAGAAQQAFYEEMPQMLRFSQREDIREAAKDVFVRRVYPDTHSDEVDAQLRMLIDDMAQRNEPLLPLTPGRSPSYLDVGAVVSRSGESVLSFLTLAEISREKELQSVEFDARVYDMRTGQRIRLGDLFDADSGAFAFLAGEMRRQLTEAFPGMEPDAQALDALCGEAALADAPFTLGAARLTIVCRADALYPGRNSLLHVNVYYPQIRDMMNEYGRACTDNSRFRMVALTYDDGGARGSTRGVINALRKYGQQATFFIVGQQIANNHDNVLRQQNGNNSIQSHTFTHRYPGDVKGTEIFGEKAQMEEALGSLTGVVPVMMRAPGGHAQFYADRGIGYPLIQWSLASGDSGNPHVKKIADKVIGSAGDGKVVLMHDLNGGSPKYTEMILENLTGRGFLCVTVEELFADAGTPLEPDVVYIDPYRIEE